MGRNIRSVFFTICAMLIVTQVLAAKSYPPMQVVPSVDLTRYLGKWYEIARPPNWFQRDCASDMSFWPFNGNDLSGAVGKKGPFEQIL
jgi:lipocalin